jgi:hypothetical protein
MSDESQTAAFEDICDVAIRLNQPPDDKAEAPEHWFFADEGQNVRTEKCLQCEDFYGIGYSRIHGKQNRTFEDLADQLQLRLAEDHKASNRKHRSIIPLRWSDTTRKRSREQNP